MSRDGEWICMATAVIFFVVAFVHIIVMFVGADFRVERAAENATWLLVGSFCLIYCNEWTARHRHRNAAKAKQEHLVIQSAFTFTAMALCFFLLDASVALFFEIDHEYEKDEANTAVLKLIIVLAGLGILSVFMSLVCLDEIYTRSLAAQTEQEPETEKEKEKEIERPLLVA